jgi:DNA-binding response OmpR family regulator
MKKVLIVEDDEFLQGLEAKKLKTSGFEVISAQTGEDALNKILEPDLSIILLDLMLPNISGFDILKKIKETEKTKNIPVIIFSNMSEEETINKAKQMGASKFMVKSSFSLSELVDEINKLI